MWIDSISGKPVASWHRGIHYSSGNFAEKAPQSTGYVSRQSDSKWDGTQELDADGNVIAGKDRSTIVVRYRPGTQQDTLQNLVRQYGFVNTSDFEAFENLSGNAAIAPLDKYGFNERSVPSIAPDWSSWVTPEDIENETDPDKKADLQKYVDEVQTPNDITCLLYTSPSPRD